MRLFKAWPSMVNKNEGSDSGGSGLQTVSFTNPQLDWPASEEQPHLNL